MASTTHVRKFDKPRPNAFLAAGYLFSKGSFAKEVPYDPHMYFSDEEISLAARAYTHGWDGFAPSRVFIYHYHFGSIHELYASSCYGGGDTGQRSLAPGASSDEVEPAQVVVQDSGWPMPPAGTLLDRTQSFNRLMAAVHRLHMQIAPNPFPHRACLVERFGGSPRARRRKVGRSRHRRRPARASFATTGSRAAVSAAASTLGSTALTVVFAYGPPP